MCLTPTEARRGRPRGGPSVLGVSARPDDSAISSATSGTERSSFHPRTSRRIRPGAPIIADSIESVSVYFHSSERSEYSAVACPGEVFRTYSRGRPSVLRQEFVEDMRRVVRGSRRTAFTDSGLWVTDKFTASAPDVNRCAAVRHAHPRRHPPRLTNPSLDSCVYSPRRYRRSLSTGRAALARRNASPPPP
jgi:hypothetical protein